MPKNQQPTSTVAGDVFVWDSPDPDVGQVNVPLKFKSKILRAAKKMQDDQLGFMFYVLDSIGVPAAQVDEMDVGELKAMFTAWQVAWAEQAGADFPEASRSSI